MNKCAPSISNPLFQYTPLPPCSPSTRSPFLPSSGLAASLQAAALPHLPGWKAPCYDWGPVCITHISVSAAPLSGRPYKGLSFSKGQE